MATRYVKPLLVGGLAIVGGCVGYSTINNMINNSSSYLLESNSLEVLSSAFTVLSTVTGGLTGLIIDKITPNNNKTLSNRIWIDDTAKPSNLK
jgi:hypothetical protein